MPTTSMANTVSTNSVYIQTKHLRFIMFKGLLIENTQVLITSNSLIYYKRLEKK